jgi:hypothetical protein
VIYIYKDKDEGFSLLAISICQSYAVQKKLLSVFKIIINSKKVLGWLSPRARQIKVEKK